MILCISVLWTYSVSPQETEAENNPLIDGVGADEPTVEVPLEYLRNALWYYDMYFVEQERAEAYGAENETLNELLDQEQERTASLEASLSVWKPVAYTTGGTLILWIALDVLMGVLQ